MGVRIGAGTRVKDTIILDKAEIKVYIYIYIYITNQPIESQTPTCLMPDNFTY